jgi:hypothetical protein
MGKPEGEGFTREDFEGHIREEYSTFGWILEGMFKKAGFDMLKADYLSPWTAEYICTLPD